MSYDLVEFVKELKALMRKAEASSVLTLAENVLQTGWMTDEDQEVYYKLREGSTDV
jgi:hypothetical protein